MNFDIEQLLSERILVIDGAMGSLIMDQKPQEADYRGERFKNHPIVLKIDGVVQKPPHRS